MHSSLISELRLNLIKKHIDGKLIQAHLFLDLKLLTDHKFHLEGKIIYRG